MAFAPIIVIVVAALTYAQAISGAFVWDDVYIVLDYPFYRDPSLLWPSLWKPFVLAPDYFRPLVLLSFYADFRLWGFNPVGFHLTNLILHALTSGLAFALIQRALRRDDLAFVGGLLFALHPAHVEAVAWVAGRFDTMMGFFYLLALWAGTAEAKTSRARLGLTALTGIASLLAVAAKEMALTLTVILPLFDVIVNRLRPADEQAAHHRQRSQKGKSGAKVRSARTPLWVWLKMRWPIYASMGLAVGIYFIGRLVSLGVPFTSEQRNYPFVGDTLQHLLLVGRSIVRYLLLLIWPFGTLSPIQYTTLPISASDSVAWLELALVVALITGGVALARRQPRLGGLLACFAASLAPVVNILPISLGGNAFAAERFLYLPSFFFLLAVLEGAMILLRRSGPQEAGQAAAAQRWLGPTLAAVAVVAYTVTVFTTVPHWRNDLALWTWGHERVPESSMPLSGLAAGALAASQDDLALSYAEQAIALNPSDATALFVRGGALMHLNRPTEAEAAYRQTLAVRPGFAQYWTGLAESLRVQGRYEEAERTLKDEALRRDPYLWPALYSLGQVYLEWGRPADAIEPLRQAVQLQPRGDVIRRFLAKALAQTGQAAEALQIYAEIVQRDPTGQSDPKNIEVYAEWGDLLWDQGERDAAKAQYTRYLELAPNGPQAGRVRQRLQN